MTNDIEKVSDCCGAAVYNGRCSDCKENAEEVYPECPLGICDGSGEVQAYDAPIEPHLPSTPAGTEPCLCQKPEEDYEPEI